MMYWKTLLLPTNKLKENLVNKSTNVTTDGASNIKYPSVKAVKDYVDVSINAGGTALTNEANIRAAADQSLTNALNTEIINRINFDLLKEDVVNKSQNVNTDAASATKYPSVKAIKAHIVVPVQTWAYFCPNLMVSSGTRKLGNALV